MANATRIYIVKPKDSADRTQHRLVKAPNPSSAIRHVARATLDCEICRVEEGMELSAVGIRVEEASAEAE